MSIETNVSSSQKWNKKKRIRKQDVYMCIKMSDLIRKKQLVDPKTGNYFQIIFGKFLRVWKDQIFP